MLKKMLNFIKYNNATVLILMAVLLLGSGVFAQTETGQEFIGGKQITVEGIDNTLLLEADLDNLDMDYKIERISEDEKYYYVTYTCLDLIKQNSAWQYQISEKVRKVSRKLKKDLGVYLAEEFKEQYDASIKYLKEEKNRAEELDGEETRVEVSAYSGLIGGVLDVAGRVFTGYEPVKVREIPSPTVPPSILLSREVGTEDDAVADSLTDVYNDYIERMDPDGDEIFGIIDNCPNIFNPAQVDSDDDGMGDFCDPEPDIANTETYDAPIEDIGEIAGEDTASYVPEIATSSEDVATSSDETSIEEIIEEIIINNSINDEDPVVPDSSGEPVEEVLPVDEGAEDVLPVEEEVKDAPVDEPLDTEVSGGEPEVEIIELPEGV